MRKRSLLAAALSLLVFPVPGDSQASSADSAEHTITGRVTDPQGLLIVDASVQLLAANRVLLREVRTDAEGRFRLAAVPAGSYELRIEARGFAVFQRLLVVPADTAQPLEISLRLTPVESQVTVTARPGALEEVLREPAAVRVRGADELARHEPAHLPRMLADEPGVLVQETSPGQGSPILRGQAAQTVLYLLDGIRFNNATYRSGNTQYLGWIPPAAVDSVEVFLGPAGTPYGSDALGGAINIISTNLPPWSETRPRWGGEVNTFFTSADLAAGSSLLGHVAGRNVALAWNGSYRRHQEMRAGGGFDSHSTLSRFLGLAPEQVRAVVGSRLPDTDYVHSGGSLKLGLRFRHDQFLTLTWLQSEEFGIRRFDRLLGGDGTLRSELAPQRLQFGYARYLKLGTRRLRSLAATFSFNRQTDGQISQRRETSPLQDERTRVTALGYSLALSWAPLRQHALSSGFEFYDEFVAAHRTDTSPTGTVQPARPRFPNGTRYQSVGLYLTDEWQALAERLLVESGVRFSAFRFRSRADKNVFIGGQPTVPDATETFTDLTFSAGLSYSLRPSLVAVGRVARGFRAPSVFDLGEQGLTGGGFEVSPRDAAGFNALVGDSAASQAVSTGQPWRALEPEVLWSFEGGLRWKTTRASGNVTVFDSEFFDSIQRRVVIVPAPVVGQTIGGQTITAQDAAGRIFVALDPRPVVSRANIGRVRIHGLEAQARMDWALQWSSTVKAALLRGRELDTGNFARRIPPAFLSASLRWSHPGGRLWLDGSVEISGAQTRLNPAELDDPRIGALRSESTITEFFNFTARRLGLIVNDRLTLTGESLDEILDRVLGPARQPAPLFTRTKGFAALSLRCGLVLSERNEILLAVTNLTDANFRRHGSGVDAPGAQLAVTYRLRFR